MSEARREPSPPPDASLERERRRLRRAFAALLVTLAPAALAQACTGSDTSRGTGGGDAGADTEDRDGGKGSTTDADAAPPDTGSDVSCVLSVVQVDAGPDVDPPCIVVFPCGMDPDIGFIDCGVYDEAGGLGCTVIQGVEGCNTGGGVPAPPGAIQLDCPGCLGSGRRPIGLVRPRGLGRCGSSAIGAYFARMAHDEAASVHAFQRLREELALHGAPALLVRAAERAARDEQRHARVMAERACAAGAPIVAPVVRRRGPRALEAIARENAVEGCVAETFGALLAGWQAAHARDASLRRMFARIAADETRHAALSWAVARWAEDRLAPGERARVAAARARAVHALGRYARAPGASFDVEVGRPSPAQRALLFEGMTRRLHLGRTRG